MTVTLYKKPRGPKPAKKIALEAAQEGPGNTVSAPWIDRAVEHATIIGAATLQFDIRQSGCAPCLYPLALKDREAARLGDWHPISTAPFDRDVQLSVIERGQVYALVFRCRRTDSGWVDAATRKLVFVDPTHWREWFDGEGS